MSFGVGVGVVGTNKQYCCLVGSKVGGVGVALVGDQRGSLVVAILVGKLLSVAITPRSLVGNGGVGFCQCRGSVVVGKLLSVSVSLSLVLVIVSVCVSISSCWCRFAFVLVRVGVAR